MRAMSWLVFFVVMPLTPILVALFVAAAQNGAAVQLDDVLAGPELFFIALFALSSTLFTLERAKGAVRASAAYRLLDAILLPSIIFVAMFTCFVFIHERIVDFEFVPGFVAKLGILTLIVASALGMAAQATLARHQEADPKRKRQESAG